MLHLFETPEETADRCLRELRASIRRAGRKGDFYYGREVEGRAMSIADRVPKKTTDPAADLPPDLRRARESLRVAYRAVRDMRAELGAGAALWPSDIVEWLDEKFPDDSPHSIDTLNHALKDLRKLRLAWAPEPSRTGDYLGWRLGSEQNVLPTGGRQSELSSTTARTGYAEVTAAEAASRTSEERPMRGFAKSVFWVPAERSEYGHLVTDAVTQEVVAVTEKTGEMKVPTRTGRLVTCPAVRAELIRVESRYAVVKLPGGKKVQTRVLGQWQLAGLAEPEPETADVASAS